jgi:cellobiose-specific phosphotransferase system component IIB
MRRLALVASALAVTALVATAAPAQAQSTPATVFCANERILVERSTIAQVQSRLGHAHICIIGPSFDFQPDGVTWVRQNLRSDVGGSCRCG